MDGSPSRWRSLCYDKAGRPITHAQWCELFSDLDYCRVARTRVGPWRISTVWLGLDHSHGYGEPVIFESLVFWDGPHGGEPDHNKPMMRYHTRAEARRGHADLVRQYRTLHRAHGAILKRFAQALRMNERL